MPFQHPKQDCLHGNAFFPSDEEAQCRYRDNDWVLTCEFSRDGYPDELVPGVGEGPTYHTIGWHITGICLFLQCNNKCYWKVSLLSIGLFTKMVVIMFFYMVVILFLLKYVLLSFFFTVKE